MLGKTVCLLIDRCKPGRRSWRCGKRACLAVGPEHWSYPKHLAGRVSGRVYGLIVHGDAEGVGNLQSTLSDWLDTLGLIGAGTQSNLGRYVGYLKPYATSHDDLDADSALWEECRNVGHAIADLRAGHLSRPDAGLIEPRPK